MKHLALVLLMGFSSVCLSQEPEVQSEDMNVPDILVFGAKEKNSVYNMAPTVSELSGTRLQRKKKSTLGETLSRETGVTSSQFGPNASRPVIRGLDADRIRVLQNGTGVLDASSASQDHAVAMDPLIVERIEILRGPGALLYGSNAIGGVVNMVTTRIPEKIPEKLSGVLDTRFASTNMERSGALALDSALSSNWALHVDGSVRGADDYRAGGDVGRIFNSYNQTGSQGVGTSYVFEKGFVGGAFSNYNSSYGTVAEPLVHINMLQQRADFAFELRDPKLMNGFFRSIQFKNSYSHYKHDEMEGSELGTVFKNDGNEARLDLKHRNVGGFVGVLGVQVNAFRFSAVGEESFLPSTDNEAYSVFFYEEKETDSVLKPSFGARLDGHSVASADDEVFGQGQKKSFTGGSAALGFSYTLNPKQKLVLNSSYTERAPNYAELFANGRHAATGVFEAGNTDLKKERSQSVELSWRHQGESSKGSVGVFLQDFEDFISLTPNGLDDGDPDEPFPVYNYLAVDARLYGLEAEYLYKFLDLIPGGILEVEVKADLVRGINRDSRENLARMTPIRETLSLIYKTSRFQTDLEVERSERQNQVADNESETKAYTLLNLGGEMPFRSEVASFSVYARVHNVFDAEARNHVSVLKEIAPLPGRSVIVGLKSEF